MNRATPSAVSKSDNRSRCEYSQTGPTRTSVEERVHRAAPPQLGGATLCQESHSEHFRPYHRTRRPAGGSLTVSQSVTQAGPRGLREFITLIGGARDFATREYPLGTLSEFLLAAESPTILQQITRFFSPALQLDLEPALPPGELPFLLNE